MRHGLSEDISRIIEQLPKKGTLFSATITNDVSNIERKYIPKAQRIVVQTYTKTFTRILSNKQNQNLLLLHLVTT